MARTPREARASADAIERSSPARHLEAGDAAAVGRPLLRRREVEAQPLRRHSSDPTVGRSSSRARTRAPRPRAALHRRLVALGEQVARAARRRLQREERHGGASGRAAPGAGGRLCRLARAAAAAGASADGDGAVAGHRSAAPRAAISGAWRIASEPGERRTAGGRRRAASPLAAAPPRRRRRRRERAERRRRRRAAEDDEGRSAAELELDARVAIALLRRALQPHDLRRQPRRRRLRRRRACLLLL